MTHQERLELAIVIILGTIALIIVCGALIASLRGTLGATAGDTLHDLLMMIGGGLLVYIQGKKQQ